MILLLRAYDLYGETLLTERVSLSEGQLRLFFQRTILEDDRRLSYYNIGNHSIIMVVERPRGGARTRCTALLKVNPPALLDEVDSENSESSSSENSNTSEVDSDTSEEDLDLSEEE